MNNPQIEQIQTAQLVPYANNSRTHSAQQIEQIAASIKEFGFTNPVLIGSDDGIIAGHGRVMAALSLGIDTVPCIRLGHLTEVQKRAYIIADNQLPLNAGWNLEMLAVELEGLRAEAFDISTIGFSATDLLDLLGGSGQSSNDPTKSGLGTLAARFMLPPFSVLNAREGWWQDRKRAWLGIGIRSEVGRGDNLLKFSESAKLGGMDRKNSNVRLTPGGGGGAWLGASGKPGAGGKKGGKKGGKQFGKTFGDAAIKQRQHVNGVLMTSDSGNDPRYYAKKQEVEKKLGRELSTEEFQRDYYDGPDSYESGTSIFDPVLCEIAYRWFSPSNGLVLDPFAGGSVRGVVASRLGRQYLGIDLRPEQVEANEAQALEICEPGTMPRWITDDSRNVDKQEVEADLVFSCPPYADLEVYSDDPRDLSTLGYEEFRAAYREIILKSCAKLKQDRFACFVVGEVRGKNGAYYNFVGDTIQAFLDAGLQYYNEAILITAVGSLPIRAGKQFSSTRKLGKTHQNVLVFLKGDARKAVEACGLVDVAEDLFPKEEDAEPDLGDGAGVTVVPAAELTPVEQRGSIWMKRDDQFSIAGVAGGKVRSCWRLAQGATGLVTAGSRASPQVNIVAHVARYLGVPCRAHTPQGDLSPEVAAAQAAGADIVQHKAGYNNVIIARAREDAAERGWRNIPFGMECIEAVQETAGQVCNIPDGVQRIVMPVGSGMSLSGVLHGLKAAGLSIPVVGIVVGADPVRRLDKYAPAGWREMVTLIPSGSDYHDEAPVQEIEGVRLDPHYEAKCIPHLQDYDLLWVVGIRASGSDQ